MVFLIIFVIGLVLTLTVFLIGELFDLGDYGDSGDAVGAETPSPLSSRILFVFITAFGGVGFIADALGWPLPLSILAGLVGGTAVAAGTFFLVVLPMARQQGSTSLKLDDLMDLEGEVTDDIPAGGIGKVVIVPPGTGARVAQATRS